MNSRPMLSCVVLIVVLAKIVPAYAQTEAPSFYFEQKLSAILSQRGLTSSEVARRAIESSFELHGKHEQVLRAQLDVKQALLGFFPRINLIGKYTRKSEIIPSITGHIVVANKAADGPLPAGAMLVQVPIDSFPFGVPLNEFFGVTTLSVPLSDYLLKLTEAYRAAQHSARAAQLTEVSARLKVARDARILFYNWVDAKLKLVVAEQALDNIKGRALDVARLFEAGRASQADVASLNARVAGAELLIQKTRDLIVATEQELRTAMHYSGRTNWVVGEDVRQMPAVPSDLDNIDQLCEEAIRQRLELRIMSANRDSLRAQAGSIRGGALPRIDAAGSAVYANPNPRYFPPEPMFHGSWEVSVQLSWSPNDIAGAILSSRSLDARAREVEAQEAAFRDVLRNVVTRAWLGFREALVAVQTSSRELESAEESYSARRGLFQVGRSTSVELMDAETGLTRARIDLINSRIASRVALVELLYAVGRDVL